MARPDRTRKPSSRRGICFNICCFPVTKTMPQAITSTTPVRMAVPRLDSTPVMPIFPRIAVRLANTAEPRAKNSQAFPWAIRVGASFFSSISTVPTAMRSVPTALGGVMPS